MFYKEVRESEDIKELYHSTQALQKKFILMIGQEPKTVSFGSRGHYRYSLFRMQSLKPRRNM